MLNNIESSFYSVVGRVSPLHTCSRHVPTRSQTRPKPKPSPRAWRSCELGLGLGLGLGLAC